MGRDWTPREHLAAEEFNIQNGLGSIWDFLENTKFHNFDGSVIPVCTEEELALRKEFPLLGKLVSNAGKFSFSTLYENLSNIEGGIDLLRSKDEELSVYIETGVGDKDSALIKWFNGELDERFYYCEENHRLFGESLIEEACLNAILMLAKNELNENGSIGFTMPDGNYHIYIYVDSDDFYTENVDDDPELYYIIEPNKVVYGGMEPMEEETVASYNDFDELLEGCKWCFNMFNGDKEISLENKIVNAEERSSNDEDFLWRVDYEK